MASELLRRESASRNSFEARARLGEGPVWDERSRQLYWVDIYNHRIHVFDPAMRTGRVIRLPGLVTCVALTSSERLLVALRHELALLDSRSGELSVIASTDGAPELRFNDGKVDSCGRFWIGTMSPKKPGSADLWRLHAAGSLERVQSGLTISNGLGWSPDHRSFYLTDSGDRTIYVYDYDAESSAISNRRVFVDLRDGDGSPDGLAVDAEGCVWSAQWDGWCVIRFDPTGTEIDRIPVPVQRPTSCAFGGDDYRTLYITSASVGLSEDEIQGCPESGDLFWIETAVRGLPSNRVDLSPLLDGA